MNAVETAIELRDLLVNQRRTLIISAKAFPHDFDEIVEIQGKIRVLDEIIADEQRLNNEAPCSFWDVDEAA